MEGVVRETARERENCNFRARRESAHFHSKFNKVTECVVCNSLTHHRLVFQYISHSLTPQSLPTPPPLPPPTHTPNKTDRVRVHNIDECISPWSNHNTTVNRCCPKLHESCKKNGYDHRQPNSIKTMSIQCHRQTT